MQAEKSDDGTQKITCKPSGADMRELCTTYLSTIEQITGSSTQYDISDVDVSLTVDAGGYLRGVTMNYSAGFDYSSNKAAAIVSVSVDYTDVSGKALPTPPEGYTEFPDYDPQANSAPDNGDAVDAKDAEAIDAAFSLFEDDHVTKVANYDELYAKYCEEYGKDMMDSIIEIIVVFGGVAANG